MQNLDKGGKPQPAGETANPANFIKRKKSLKGSTVRFKLIDVGEVKPFIAMVHNGTPVGHVCLGSWIEEVLLDYITKKSELRVSACVEMDKDRATSNTGPSKVALM